MALAKGLRIKMEAAELAAVKFTEEARSRLTLAIQRHADAQTAFAAEHTLLQETIRRKKAAVSISNAVETRHAECMERHQSRIPFKEASRLVSTAEALPKKPWKLPPKEELSLRYALKSEGLRKAENQALAATEGNEVKARNVAKEGFLADANAEDIVVAPHDDAEDYLQRAQREGEKSDDMGRSQGERAARAAKAALETAKLALVPVQEDTALTMTAAQEGLGTTSYSSGGGYSSGGSYSSGSGSDDADVKAAAAGEKVKADAEAKATADAAAQQEAQSQAEAKKAETDAASKAKQDQDAANAEMAKAKADAEDKAAAKKKKEEDKAVQEKAKAEKKVRKLKEKERAKAQQKKKEEREQKALNRIKLTHTGMHDLKRSNARAQGRLDRHFHESKADLWNTLKRQIQRLERSPGGTAARKVAREIRSGALTLHSIYGEKYAQLEATDPYATSLRHLVKRSWWHHRYKLRVLSMRKEAGCDGIKRKKDLAQCLARQRTLQLQLATALRKKDTVFQAGYAKLQKRHGRQNFIIRKRLITDAYHLALDKFHEAASLKIIGLLEAEP